MNGEVSRLLVRCNGFLPQEKEVSVYFELWELLQNVFRIVEENFEKEQGVLEDELDEYVNGIAPKIFLLGLSTGVDSLRFFVLLFDKLIFFIKEHETLKIPLDRGILMRALIQTSKEFSGPEEK
jgi:hypothetical protein